MIGLPTSGRLGMAVEITDDDPPPLPPRVKRVPKDQTSSDLDLQSEETNKGDPSNSSKIRYIKVGEVINV